MRKLLGRSPSAHRLPPLVPSTLYSVGAGAGSSGPLADQTNQAGASRRSRACARTIC